MVTRWLRIVGDESIAPYVIAKLNLEEEELLFFSKVGNAPLYRHVPSP